MRTNKDIEEKYTFHMEVHDFGFLLPGLDDLLRLRKIYPNFKITCFTIPLPAEFYFNENSKHFSIEKYKRWAEIINSYDWIEIGIHGFSHTKGETDHEYQKIVDLVKGAENLFNQVGLKYKKLYVAPYWQYSYDALNALRDLDYIVGINRNNPIPTPENLKKFIYTWSYEELALPSGFNIIGHGHTTSRGVQNGIAQCYNNIINLIPKNAKFGFLSELIEKQYEKNSNEQG